MRGSVTDILEVFTNTSDGVCALDTDLRIIFWNQAAQEILGFTPEEAIGHYCYEIIAGKDESCNPLCSRTCQIVNLARRGRKVQNRDLLTESKEGKAVWVNMSTLVIPSRYRALNAIVHIFRDITDRKYTEMLIQEIIPITEEIRKEGRSKSFRSFIPLQPKARLTPREKEVVKLMARGAGTKEVAMRLHIRWATARNHIQHILTKLGVHTRLEAVIYAIKNKLI